MGHPHHPFLSGLLRGRVLYGELGGELWRRPPKAAIISERTSSFSLSRSSDVTPVCTHRS